MSQVLLTRETNHPFVNGILPFISTALGIYMALKPASTHIFSMLFGSLAGFSFLAGIAFWRTRNLITSTEDHLVFRGFFSQFRLPASSVKSIQTEKKLFGTYKLLIRTKNAIYRLSIPAPNGAEWAQLRRRLDNHDTFPHHLN